MPGARRPPEEKGTISLGGITRRSRVDATGGARGLDRRRFPFV